MAACEHGSTLLGAHVLGGLDEADTRAVEEHLAGCERCRAEAADLRGLRDALDAVPPEAFLDGPPDGADLLLERTLRQARAERAGRRRVRLAVATASAAAAVAALFASGIAVGRVTGDDGVNGGQAADTPSATPTPPAGTRVASATDPTTGAQATVRVEPAAGWVRVHATVTGVPAGQRCRLVVTGAGGARVVAGSWLVSETGQAQGTTLDGAALVPPQDVRAVVVENVEGRRFVSVPI